MARTEDRARVRQEIDAVRFKGDDLLKFTVPSDMKTLYTMISTIGLKPEARKLFLRKCDFNLRRQTFTIKELTQELKLDKYQYFRLNDFRKKRCHTETDRYGLQ